MKDLLDKLSSYNIFNYLLPGILFVGLSKEITSFSLVQDNLLIGLFLYYFIGLIISRIGSLTVEPFLKWIKFVKFADYKDYVKASELDPKVDLFSEQNNMYRTLCSLPIALILFKIYGGIEEFLSWNTDTRDITLLIGLLILFLFSYRKQTKYVVQRIETVLEKEEE